jgi:peroxiredoxin
MQPRIAGLAVLLALGVLISTAVGQDAGGKPQAPATKESAKVGQAAPDFALLDSEGKQRKLSDYSGKVVVLEWLSQQCPWSRKALPIMKDLRKKYDGKGIVWLGLDSTNGRKPEENVQYTKDQGLDFPILMDTEGTVGHLFGARTTPHVFVINKGKLVYAGALNNNQQGDKKADEVRNYLDEALTAVLAGKDVPAAETTPWGCGVKYKEADKPAGGGASAKHE